MKKIAPVVFMVVFWVVTGCAQQYSFQFTNYGIPTEYPAHVGVGDFNGDGKNDVITTGRYPDQGNSHMCFFIYLQTPAGVLSTSPLIIPFPSSTDNYATGMAVADMNNDNLDDVIVSAEDSVYVYYQTPAHTFLANPVGHSVGNLAGTTAAMRVADIDVDGYMDIVTSFFTDTFITVLYGTGVQDSFVAMNYPSVQGGFDDLKVGYPGYSRHASIFKVSLEGSHTTSIIETVIQSNRISDTTVFFTTTTDNTWGFAGVAIGDRFGDGHNELVTTVSGNVPVASVVVWDKPDSVAVSNLSVLVPNVPQAVVMADLNCDGKDEIIMGHGGWNQVSIVTQANDVLTFHDSIPNNMEFDGLAVADVTGDGKPDIIVVNSYAGLTVLVNTTAEIIDSTILSSDTTGFDTTILFHTYDSILHKQTIYNGRDSVMETSTLVVRAYSADSMLNVTNSGSARARCSGSTSLYLSNTQVLVSELLYNDTTIIVTDDTLYPAAVPYIPGYEPSLQLSPNPFGNQATVQYTVATGTKNASLIIYDMLGQQRSSYTLSNTDGQITINANNLSGGVYLYSLVVDGRVLVTKRMVVEE